MKFVAISDTHCRHRSIRLPKGDVLLHAGDVSYRGEKKEIEDFLEWFASQPHMHKIFIAGNHDFFFEREKASQIKALIPESIHYLKDDAIVINGIKIWGSPYTPWFFRWAFNKRRGTAMASHWDKIPPDADIVMTHGPAYGVLDLLVNEEHAGDKDLMNKLLAVKPRVHLCGHIHESYGWVKRHGIKFINACVLNEGYEMANKPIVFDL